MRDEATRIFHQACDLSSAERESYLAETCGDDLELRDEVLAMLRGDDEGPIPATWGSPARETGDARRPKRLGAGERVAGFELVRLLGEGGMGQVWEAQELSLERRVALKVLRSDLLGSRTLAYFEREARAGGRLRHPGVVAVFAAGEADGVAYIAQELVEGGRTLADEIRQARELSELPGDYFRGVAEQIAAVADALEVAHGAGVIHRDLKPQNLLLAPGGPGAGGQVVKVGDFGLARIEGELSLSVSGEVAGTYYYMSPEQTRGIRSETDHKTDIFSLGVVLYECLTLVRPFDGDTSHQVVRKINEDEPVDPRVIRSRVPRELALICGKALEKRADDRYPRMAELAEDLRRFLAHEPIHVRPPTRLRLAQKWMLRHPVLASTLAVVTAALIVITALLVQVLRTKDALDASLVVSERRRGDAEDAKRKAQRRADEVLRLSAFQDLDRLTQVADDLWPAVPANMDAYESWIGEAERLLADLGAHRAKRDELRALARERTEDEVRADAVEHPALLELREARARIADLEGRLDELVNGVVAEPQLIEIGTREEELEVMRLREEELTAGLDKPWRWRFDDRNDSWWHAELSRLIARLEALADESTGLLGRGISTEHGWGIGRRLDFAKTLEERSRSGPDAGMRWAAALEAVASSPIYGGLEIGPQLGLLPLGEDPNSGLQEFAHLQTGRPARRGPDGELALSEDTGLVFVLIPAGKFWMGAQAKDPDGRNYDPSAAGYEGPPHEVELSAYLLSKYEMTQGQWEWVTGTNPSQNGPWRFSPFWDRNRPGWSALHPVEQLSWTDCMALLDRLALTLPSEAQWEYAARAGTSSVYWTGDDVASLQGAANLSDEYGKANGNQIWKDWERGFDDGNTVHAVVGTYRANGFGLHDVAGNLWEWCLDGYQAPAYRPNRPKDPVVPWADFAARVRRGGSFVTMGVYARSATRSNHGRDTRYVNVGLRPAMRLQR